MLTELVKTPNPQKACIEERLDIVVRAVRRKAKRVDLTVFEQYPRHAKGSAVQVLAGLFHVLTYELWRRDLPWVEVNGMTLKKAATGSGRASKEEMLESAQVYAPSITNHNVADAIHLARYGYEYYDDLVEEGPEE